jgi:hypothetical protein
MKSTQNRLGDDLELSVWYNADKPGEAANAEKAIYKAFILTEDQHDLRVGTVDFEILTYGEERVPAPPPEYKGTPTLMIGTATVIKVLNTLMSGDVGFTQDVDEEDLTQLRAITQEAYLGGQPPGTAPLTNEQLDKVIDEVGPETAVKSLRSGDNERRLT